MVAHRWRPIEDLPKDWRSLSGGDLEEVISSWRGLREQLAQAGKLEEFNQQIGREWAIETGVIEGVYRIERGITRTLIERGIEASRIRHDATDRPAETVARIVQDHFDALEHLFAFVKDERVLSVNYIKQLHIALLKNTDTYVVIDPISEKAVERPLEKGVFKRLPNSPNRPGDGELHEYCHPDHTDAEMDRLIELHLVHQREGIAADVQAAWLHHAFTQIHPFPDGNGRVARALASLVLIKEGVFPLTIDRDQYVSYLDSLETADRGDLRPFVLEIGKSLRHQLLRAHSLSARLSPPFNIEEELQTAADRLEIAGDLEPVRWVMAKQHANRLYEMAQGFLSDTARRLHLTLGGRNSNYVFRDTCGSGRPYPPSMEIASRLGHKITQSRFQAFAELLLKTRSSAHLSISFDAHSPRSDGKIFVFAILWNESENPLYEAVTDRPFVIQHDANSNELREEFRSWLEQITATALRQWGAGV